MKCLSYSIQDKIEISLYSIQFKNGIIIGVCTFDVTHDIIYISQLQQMTNFATSFPVFDKNKADDSHEISCLICYF